jgi:hypothetical protein
MAKRHPQNLSAQMLAAKNGIPQVVQERLAKIPGRQRIAIARRHIPVAASSNDNIIKGTGGAATIIFLRQLSTKEKKGIDINPHLTPPESVKIAFEQSAGELTRLIRKKQITVLFTNAGDDMDRGRTGFIFQVVPDNRKMSGERYGQLVGVMNKIVAQLNAANDNADPVFTPIVYADRPIGFFANMLNSNLANA